MKVLFIGGSGNISSEVSKYAISKGIDLYHLNRGNRPTLTGIKNLIGDIHDVESMKKVLEGHEWDVVVNWIAFKPNDVLQDIELFKGKTNIFLSVLLLPIKNHQSFQSLLKTLPWKILFGIILATR